MSFPDRTTDVLLTLTFFVSLCVIIHSARRILLIFVFAVSIWQLCSRFAVRML
jgi:hypothetical protein